MDFLALFFGLAIVWALGAAAVALVARPLDAPWRDGDLAWMMGCGWFVGAFLLTLWMRLLSAMHVPFAIISIGAPIAVIAGLLVWRGRTLTAPPWNGVCAAVLGRHASGWNRAAWLLLLTWLAIRFALLLNEIMWRPLFPWDAWSQWGSKARVWFELKTMAPFVTTSEWLYLNSPNVYFDAAPHYPGTVPLFQVWPAILLGRWDDSLVNLPWWLTGLAFAFAIYGYLARNGFTPLAALVGTWLVVSLPFFEVHIALAGYADLAMSTYFTLAALWSLQAVRTRTWRDCAVAVFFLAACVLIKIPGKVWIATLVPGIVMAFLPRRGLRVVAAMFIGALCVMIVLAHAETKVLGYNLHLDFAMPWRPLFDAYFTFGNWNLLAYGAIAIAVLARRELLSPDVAPLTVTLAAGLLVLGFGFAFSNAGAWVEDQSTVNRATLTVAPLLTLWMLWSFRAWSRRRSPRGTAIGEPGTDAAPNAV
jgi:hypothetical protein